MNQNSIPCVPSLEHYSMAAAVSNSTKTSLVMENQENRVPAIEVIDLVEHDDENDHHYPTSNKIPKETSIQSNASSTSEDIKNIEKSHEEQLAKIHEDDNQKILLSECNAAFALLDIFQTGFMRPAMCTFFEWNWWHYEVDKINHYRPQSTWLGPSLFLSGPVSTRPYPCIQPLNFDTIDFEYPLRSLMCNAQCLTDIALDCVHMETDQHHSGQAHGHGRYSRRHHRRHRHDRRRAYHRGRVPMRMRRNHMDMDDDDEDADCVDAETQHDIESLDIRVSVKGVLISKPYQPSLCAADASFAANVHCYWDMDFVDTDGVTYDVYLLPSHGSGSGSSKQSWSMVTVHSDGGFIGRGECVDAQLPMNAPQGQFTIFPVDEQPSSSALLPQSLLQSQLRAHSLQLQLEQLNGNAVQMQLVNLLRACNGDAIINGNISQPQPQQPPQHNNHNHNSHTHSQHVQRDRKRKGVHMPEHAQSDAAQQPNKKRKVVPDTTATTTTAQTLLRPNVEEKQELEHKTNSVALSPTTTPGAPNTPMKRLSLSQESDSQTQQQQQPTQQQQQNQPLRRLKHKNSNRRSKTVGQSSDGTKFCVIDKRTRSSNRANANNANTTAAVSAATANPTPTPPVMTVNTKYRGHVLAVFIPRLSELYPNQLECMDWQSLIRAQIVFYDSVHVDQRQGQPGKANYEWLMRQITETYKHRGSNLPDIVAMKQQAAQLWRQRQKTNANDGQRPDKDRTMNSNRYEEDDGDDASSQSFVFGVNDNASQTFGAYTQTQAKTQTSKQECDSDAPHDAIGLSQLVHAQSNGNMNGGMHQNPSSVSPQAGDAVQDCLDNA